MPPPTPGGACVVPSEVRVGGGGFTANERVPEVPPAVVTETFCAPKAALAPIWKVAVMVVLFTTVVLLMVTPVPPKLIAAPGMKLAPVRVKLTFVPGSPLEGLMVPRVGGGACTVKVTLPEVPPLVVTETYCVPVAALAAMARVAVMVVLFTTAVLLMITPAPLKLSTAPLRKVVPVRVTLTLLP